MSSITAKSPLPIPESDWQTDLYWSQVFAIEDRTFREKKIPDLEKNYGLKTLRFGQRVLIKGSDLILAIEKQNAEKEKPKASSRKRRR